MPWKDLQKIAIQFTAAFIVAAIFASVAPGAANKVMAFVGDKLGFEEPSIGYFTVTPENYGTGDEGKATVTYSILGNLRDVEKILVYHKVTIPKKLGEPDNDGIYSYQGGAGGVYESKVYYRYVFANSITNVHKWLWQWSFDKKTWMGVETTTAPGNPANPFRKTLGAESRAIINYLNSLNPDPKGIGEAYTGNPSLTTGNIFTDLDDAKGKITTENVPVNYNVWNLLTMELYISNGDVESKGVVVKVGIPVDQVPHQT